MAEKDPEIKADPLAAVVDEAQERFKQCMDWEGMARTRWLQDLKFAEADADNMYQWPNEIASMRLPKAKPCLTINKVRQHNLQIINESKQNKPGVAIRPVNDTADYEGAQVYEGIIRQIEYQSNAQTAYDVATEFQVKAGIGYWRVITDYLDDEVFDQEIYIRPIPNPLNVLLDWAIKERDGSDARFGFIFDDVPKDKFDKDYPQYKDMVGEATLDSASGWITKETVRVAEYFRKVEKSDRLLSIVAEGGIRKTVRASELPDEIIKKLTADKNTAIRPVKTISVEWYLIVGNKVVEQKPWPGKYIPIVRVVGEETIIEGKLDRKGHTRAMIDPQRMYNYWSSSAVEHVALQSKTPWVGPAKAFEGYEQYWETANTADHSFLPYNDKDDDGQDIRNPPQRAEPPQMAQAYIDGLKISSMELKEASGQYQAELGQQGNERSAKAIHERKSNSEVSTFHFTDNLGLAIAYTGKIILDLIPKIYDTERVVRMLGEDGSDAPVKIDPAAGQLLQVKRDENNQIVERVLNPKLAKFAVRADVGPAFATKRQAAFDAITLVLTQNPQLASLIGDIMLKAADFPMANEAAERLKRAVPKEILGEGPDQHTQMLQMQVANLAKSLEDALNKLAQEKLRNMAKDTNRVIDAHEAETKRLAVLKDLLPTDPNGVVELVQQTVRDALSQHLEELQNVTLDRAKIDRSPLPENAGGNGVQPMLPFPMAPMGQPHFHGHPMANATPISGGPHPMLPMVR